MTVKDDFQKIKRFVLKRFPGSYTHRNKDGTYVVLNGFGYNIVSPELLLPPAHTVRAAWTQAKYAAWFSNMIRKSNAAFSEEKMYKKMAKDSHD